ncbi:hypothetical protein D770_05815 [Flammeovirgaceae bacterium 311]|nr:hypothetical protein D770_05815 [Flammeovirgaceae bacterium 311]
MKKTIFYTSAALLMSLGACDSRSNENQTTASEQGDPYYEKHTDVTTISREDHIKLVKADQVPTFSNVNAVATTNISTLTDQYLQMKEALVASNPEGASNAASAMLTSLKAWDGNEMESDQKDFYQQRSSAMRDDLQQMVGNGDIVKQRDHFARISKHMTELVSAFGTGQGSLYYQYCPMAFDNKGGYWLSSSKEIRNPFYPEEMLTCGRVEKTL